MTKPNKSRPYRIFRATPTTAALVLQIADPESGEPVQLHELEAYIAGKKLDSPWFQVGLPTGSRLLLTPSAARFLLAAGSIKTLEEPILVPLRDARGQAKPGIGGG
jgi:hypothetical protein